MFVNPYLYCEELFALFAVISPAERPADEYPAAPAVASLPQAPDVTPAPLPELPA